MGFESDDYYGGTFWDKAESLPGCFIIQREIKKALTGKPFFVNDEETGKPIRLIGIDYGIFSYYYKIWENFHYFGLPHGRGWTAEREWLLEFLKSFEKSYKDIVNFIDQKAIDKQGK